MPVFGFWTGVDLTDWTDLRAMRIPLNRVVNPHPPLSGRKLRIVALQTEKPTIRIYGLFRLPKPSGMHPNGIGRLWLFLDDIG